MKFGLRCTEGGPTFDEALDQAVIAEELGFHSVWLGEHHGFDNYWPSPQVALAGFAARTERIKLGTNILILPLVNPVRLAGEWALLDQVSHGRTILGVGTGWSRSEFATLGVPFERRGARTSEYIRLIRELWTQKNVSFQGDFWTVEDFTLSPRPVQQPHPPIWIGGRAQRSLQRAVDLGDAWFPDAAASVTELRECKVVYDALLEQAGIDGDTIERPTTRHIILAETHEAAWRKADPYLAAAYKLHRERGNPLIAEDTGNLDDFVRDRYIVGDPESCKEEIASLGEDIGINHLLLKFAARLSPADARAEMELFASSVMPDLS